MSLDEAGERLLGGLDESVTLRLMSDVPLGAMLSGGLDSSLIVALMARQMSEPVKTFSVGFAEAGEGNELADARLVAELFGTDHHELELSFAEETVDLAELVWHLDEPLADLSSLGFLALSRARGRARHRRALRPGRRRAARRLPQASGRRARRGLAAPARLDPLPRVSPRCGARPARFGRASRTLAAPDPATRLLAMSGNLDDGLRQRARPRAARRARRRRGAARSSGSGSATVADDPLPATLYLDGQLGLVDDMLHYFDRASMAHSLEVRVPFLDHHVVELCATIPARLKVRRLDTKHVLKHAARGLVPDRIIDKPKVGFFNAAVDGWFRAQTQRRDLATTCSGRTRATPSCSTAGASRSSSGGTQTARRRGTRTRCSRS